MIKGLQEKFDELELVLKSTISYMDTVPEEVLSKDLNDQWNALEILNHLYISEMGTTKYLEKKCQAPAETVKKGGLNSWFRSKMLQRALNNYQKKFKAPKVVGSVKGEIDYGKLKLDLISNRAELATVLGTFTPDTAKRAFFRHPLAGRLTIYQTMDFLVAHFKRHAEQIKERTS